MKIKYFRFLYCVTKSCFIHFGEVKDTKMGETVSFLYLRGAQECVNQKESEHMLFLCPDYVDYAVLGQVDGHVEAELRELLKHTKVGTLVVPAKEYDRFPEKMEGADEIVFVGNGEAMCGRQESGEKGTSVPFADCLERTAAGWKLSVRNQGEGALAMLHMHESDCAMESQNGPDGGTEHFPVYDDFVMNVKPVNKAKRCCQNASPDEFGCALGCVLHQDYDVCKYRKMEEKSGYLTGTLLLGSMESNSDFVFSEEERRKIRFFAADNREKTDWANLLMEQENDGPKRYYIGTEMSDEAVAAVCRSGINRIPVLLQEGCGICCAGLMKYAEDK